LSDFSEGLPMDVRKTFVTVHQAAEILGVAPNTVRSWGAAGKIPEYRHPLNGYRFYKRSDLARILRQFERSLVASSALKPNPRR
jgi:DNA (cytosine-5)-methyltransferase 1